MTSASTGWALRWTQNPAILDGSYLSAARTTDGARTWTSVTPPAARMLLATPDAQAVLWALDGRPVVLADYDRLVVTRSNPDGTVYVLRPPRQDPAAILRVARLVLREGLYGELAEQLGMPAGWPTD